MTEHLSDTGMLRRIELLEFERDGWQELAETDKLTGMPNRRALERRVSAREGWFVFCDLNGFKKAQDASPLGHEYGDAMLIEFGNYLDSITRTGRGRAADRVSARVGGDEFVVWCPTRHGARRIKRCVRLWRSEDGKVGCAAGLGKNIEAADAAMYLNKKSPMQTASEMLRTLISSMKPTVGNYTLRTLLGVIATEAADVERERDDLAEEIKCLGEVD